MQRNIIVAIILQKKTQTDRLENSKASQLHTRNHIAMKSLSKKEKERGERIEGT